MLRPVTWRFWLLVAALVAAYVGAGAVWDDNARVTGDLNDVAWLALFFTPLAVLAVVTATQKWWTNDVGVNLMFNLIGLLPMAGILCWVFYRDGGQITTGTMAWAFIGGPLWKAGTLGWRAWLYLRLARERRLEREASGGEP